MRRFVVIGNRASAGPEFSLIDLAGTSGRLDVLLRCLRAALLYSHGLRRDTIVYLVLLGGPRAPRVLRVDGPTTKFVRPDERNLGTFVQKALAMPAEGPEFVEVRKGVFVADGGLDVVFADVGDRPRYVLEESAPDLRGAALDLADPVIFLGDHLGFDEATRAAIEASGAQPISIGPVSVHADDAVTVVVNELDRREALRGASS